MPAKPASDRDVADRLFYESGFEATSFADIAKDLGLSRGNFYYHFKTKNRSRRGYHAAYGKYPRYAGVLGARCVFPHRLHPQLRSYPPHEPAKIMAYGCPVGTLCNELAKLDHLAKNDATGCSPCSATGSAGSSLGSGAKRMPMRWHSTF